MFFAMRFILAFCKKSFAPKGVKYPQCRIVPLHAYRLFNRRIKMLEGQDTTDASSASSGCESTARIACEVNGDGNAVSSRNPPKRLMGGSMPRLSAVGIPVVHGGRMANMEANMQCRDCAVRVGCIHWYINHLNGCESQKKFKEPR
jgi:hypothetical protein